MWAEPLSSCAGRGGRVNSCLCVIALVALSAACATRIPPPLPATLAHPEFQYPSVPEPLQSAPGASRVEIGWRYLQVDDLKNASLEFGVALKLGPRLYPARVGQGYVAMVMRDYKRALTAFDAALDADRRYLPALVSRGQALLALKRPSEALAAFEQALAVDPSLTDLNRRVEVLRFRDLQDLIDAAHAADTAGRVDEARQAYERALARSPESAFLHRDLGMLEHRAGRAEPALEHLRRAVALDPSDGASLAVVGELLEARGQVEEAEAAYRKAAALDPGLDLAATIARVSERTRELRLPPQFQQALASQQLTRGDLAALIGVRLQGLLRTVPPRQVVITDTQQHWASNWISEVAAAGVIEPFENHTFQPEALVRRGDLAAVAGRLVDIVAESDPVLRKRLTVQPTIADLTPRHVQYGAVVAVVSAGVMPLVEGDRFQVTRQVTGQEASQVIDRIRLLAGATPGVSRQ